MKRMDDGPLKNLNLGNKDINGLYPLEGQV